MDIRWGYNNVRIHDSNQWKAVFKMNKGLFEPMVMFFSLTNSPATFQAMMDDIFRNELAQGWLKIYMDNILVATKGTKAEHYNKVNLVLQCLQDHDLFLKSEKCKFAQHSVDYLSVVISTEGVGMDTVKLQGLVDWLQPTTIKEVRSFLGFSNFYKPFIVNYARLACPLHDLTKKHTSFHWGPAQQGAFAALKQCFASQPVLSMIEPARPFILQTDASTTALGATLSQANAVGIVHPVAFFSASLLPAEINYDIYDCELLAIVCALHHWRHHLLGAHHPIRILTDHNNLIYFCEPHKISYHQARWHETLLKYDFTLKHVPGHANTTTDFLSRRPDLEKGVISYNDNITLLPDSLFSMAKKIFLAEDRCDTSTSHT